MIILYFILGLIILWAIIGIFTQRKDDEKEQQGELEELKKISELEEEIEKIKRGK